MPEVEVPAYWPAVPGKIAIVAEAPGESEVRARVPLVGPSGQLLDVMLSMAQINTRECLKTNVFSVRPAGNRVEYFCSDKKSAGKDYPVPALSAGQYVRREYLHHLGRLREELEAFAPNIVIALGNTAIWALLGRTGIRKARGAVALSTLVPGLKVLPTYHPAAVLRAYELKVVVTADLIKAKTESQFPEVRREKRTVFVPETPQEVEDYFHDYMRPSRLVSVDIETKPPRLITCIGFAVVPEHCLVVPFVRSDRHGGHYWTSDEETRVCCLIRDVLSDPAMPVLGQNFCSYDLWVLKEVLGIKVRNFLHDTMIEAHALQQELEKDLGFLTATYCNEPAYKLFRPRGMKAEKREE